jgi:uncharacterized membrane protein YfcA
MPPAPEITLAILILLLAALYSAVGHAGASGYLAAMALLAVAPDVMKPTALVLNVLVASIATTQFYRRGAFVWRTFWPFAAGSIPLAFVGGAWRLPGNAYKVVVGVILLLSASLLVVRNLRSAGLATEARRPPVLLGIAFGAGIGLLSGLTGTGGGIFLSPLLLLCRWSEMPKTAGIAAAFILANSLAGLAGNVASVHSLPPDLWLLVLAAGVGGLIGSQLGSKVFPPKVLRYLLAAVLVIAASKLVLSGM